MQMWIHIILAVLFTAYFIFRFIKDRFFYQLLFVIWIPTTLLVYATDDPVILRILGIAQIVLFLLVIFFMFRRRGAHRQNTLSLLAKMAAEGAGGDDDVSAESKVEELEAEVVDGAQAGKETDGSEKPTTGE